MDAFLATCKKIFGYAMLFSMFINILQLTFSIYMLQVYDRVLTSYNVSTLVVITLAAVVASRRWPRWSGYAPACSSGPVWNLNAY